MTNIALDCLLDRQPLAVDSGLKTWGELLDQVDRQVGEAGRAVTAVRFDGVDQPSFRDSELARRPLTALDGIEVESLDTRTLLRNTVIVGVDGLAVLASGSRRVADAFRGADAARANEELASLLEGVRSLMTLTAAMGDAAAVNVAALACGSTTGGGAIARVADALEALIASQQKKDWAALADRLEFALAPALVGWRDVLDAIGLRCAA